MSEQQDGEDAWRVVGVEGIEYIGAHGLGLEPRAEEWRERLRDFAATVDWPVEDKGLTISFHYRGADDEDAARAQLEEVAARATADGLRARFGRKVLELRPPVDADKGTAVRRLLADGPVQACALRGRRHDRPRRRSAGSRTPSWSWRSASPSPRSKGRRSWLRRQTSSLTAPPVCSTCCRPCSAFGNLAAGARPASRTSSSRLVRSLPTTERSTVRPFSFVGLMKISPVALTRSTSSSFASSLPSRRKQTTGRRGTTSSHPAAARATSPEDRGEPHRLAYPRLQAPPARSTEARPRAPGPGTAVRTQARSRSGSRPRAPRCARTPAARRRRAGDHQPLRPNAQQSIGVNSHLCAPPTPSRRARHPRATRRTRDRPRTRPHMRRRRAATRLRRASVRDLRDRVDSGRRRGADRGDDRARVVEVEGVRPQANSSSTGASRSASPSRRAARAVAGCACSEQTTARRPRLASRAAARTAIVPMEAVSSVWPCQPREAPAAGEPREHDLLRAP